MSPPIQRTVIRALRTALDLAGVDVVYVAGEARIAMAAVKSEANVEVILADGSITTARSTVWRFPRSRLVSGGAQIIPARGHTIEYQREGNVAQVFEVQPMGGLPAYSSVDPWETWWLVRSKLIEQI